MLVSFPGQVSLLTQFLDRRTDIVESIDATLLNVRGKETARSRDRRHFERLLDACFFNLPGLPRELSRLKGQLAAQHLADGFEPVVLERYSHELDPLELIVRAYGHWEQHRWPGKSGRLAYAQTVFSVFVLRQLEHLSLRIWDDGTDGAEGRLEDVQRLLDRLNDPAMPNVLVRDARWLIQTAQGPLTRHLQPYFTVAAKISGSLTPASRLELHKAGAKLAGGHLRSQLRYRVWNTGRPVDDPEVLAFTRNSNSMDNALLVRDLVPLLEAYKQARIDREVEAKLELADAILQAVSADPELFLTRLDLLAPSTMIEELFLDRGEDGRPHIAPLGQTHLDLLAQYTELIGHLAEPLREDAAAFDPGRAAYSPQGITYGFCADILSNMAVSALVAQPSFGLSFEDTFGSRGDLDSKLARAQGWQKLPTREGEREHFDHSSESAAQSFTRMVQALEARASHRAKSNASGSPDRALFVVPESDPAEALPDGFLPDGIVLAHEYCLTSDLKRSSAEEAAAVAYPRSQILNDRREGRFLASSEADGKWFAISKLILTLFTSQGYDALIADVPRPVIDVLRLTCPGLLRLPPASSEGV